MYRLVLGALTSVWLAATVSAVAQQVVHHAAPALAPDFSVSIMQHKSISQPITDAEADRVLEKMSSMFASESPPCRAKFARVGAVGSFGNDDYPFSINSEADFNKFKKDPPSLKVVGEINWCGGLGNGIIGCSSTPGPAWTVVRYEPQQEYLLWAHEYGHTTGLPHRDEANALMRPIIMPTDTQINKGECNHILAGSPAVHPGMGAAGLDGPPTSSESGGSKAPTGAPEPITAFVKNSWVEGTPFNLAKRYTNDDAPILSGILNDESKSDLWRNAVATLGAIGTPQAKEILMRFLLDKPDAALSAAQYIAKSNVPISLGWLVGRNLESHTPDVEAVATLVKMTRADWWTDIAKINWKTPIHNSQAELTSSLVTKASVGCALSGSEECRIRLVQLEKAAIGGDVSPPSPPDAAFLANSLGAAAALNFEAVSPATKRAITNNGGESLISNLLQERGKIQAAGGLSAYYSR